MGILHLVKRPTMRPESFCDKVLCLWPLVQSQYITSNAEKIRTFTWANCESTKITKTTHYNDDRPECLGRQLFQCLHLLCHSTFLVFVELQKFVCWWRYTQNSLTSNSSLISSYLREGSQIRDPRAACGPRGIGVALDTCPGLSFSWR